MGFQLLNFIAQQCQTLTATRATDRRDRPPNRLHPRHDHARLVRHSGGVCVRSGRSRLQYVPLPQLFLLITFAYTFVKYYDSTIPGFGYSLKSYISQGTTDLANPSVTIRKAHAALHRHELVEVRPRHAMFIEPYMYLRISSIRYRSPSSLRSSPSPIAYGEIAAAIIGILGPIFIPFMVFGKPNFCSGDGSERS